MINQLIASYAREALSSLFPSVISRLTGLVKVLETDAFTKGKTARFPIPVEAGPSVCSTSSQAFPDLVPTSRERLILYFEETQGAKCLNGSNLWQTQLRLIAWGNGELIKTSTGNYGSAIPILIAECTRLLTKRPRGNIENIGSIHIEVTGSPESGANLFSKYTYSEIKSQYLLPPYFAFGLDLSIRFTLQNECIDSLICRAPSECA